MCHDNDWGYRGTYSKIGCLIENRFCHFNMNFRILGHLVSKVTRLPLSRLAKISMVTVELTVLEVPTESEPAASDLLQCQ